MLRFDIITIFPQMFDSYLTESILARAQARRLVKINVHNLRDWTTDRHRTVDDTPYGGGAGMVLKIEPIYRAVQSLNPKLKAQSSKPQRKTQKSGKQKIVLLSAKGKQFTQQMARKWAKLDRITLLCGRYEGVDERVAKYVADEEISVGPYVLTGGELPAMMIVDAVTRLVPGVLGNKESLREESFSQAVRQEGKKARSLASVPLCLSASLPREYPHYTRPEVFSLRKGVSWRVPKVLLSGDHKKIASWRLAHAKQK